jgi:hypothetical protein
MLPLPSPSAAVSLSASQMVVVGAVAGLVAAFVMDWPMSRQPDGFVPALVATALVTRQSLDAVQLPETMVLHHAAGALSGVLYALVVVAVDTALPTAVSPLGLNLVGHLVAVGAVVGFIYTFFAHGVLPRAGGHPYEEQATAVRGQWLRSTLVFGSTLLVGVPLLLVSLFGS